MSFCLFLWEMLAALTFFPVCLVADIEPLAINMIELSQEIKIAEQKGALTEKLLCLEEQIVLIKGFIHQLPTGEYFLSSQARIKSCCMSKDQLQRVVYLQPNLFHQPKHNPCTLKGVLELSLIPNVESSICLSILKSAQEIE